MNFDIERRSFWNEEVPKTGLQQLAENIAKLEKFFSTRNVDPKEYERKISIRGYEVVAVSSDIETDDGEYRSFDNLTQDEAEELLALMEDVEADEYKTEKRASN